MSYGLIYKILFSTLKRKDCIIEIEKDGYAGEVIELTPSDTPFTVDIADEDFIYTPTRFSTGKIGIVGSDYLRNLFSTAYKQYRVTFKKNDVVTWCGYVKPELYTQDYSTDLFNLEIECMSAMSVLEYMDYTMEEGSEGFVTLWNLIKKCVEASGGRYDAVYIPYVYASSKEAYDNDENILESMTISEQNFFDEEGKAMKLKEVLEEICKFLNWTCVDWRGELYFIDVDHTGKYHRYNAAMTSKIDVEINTMNVQDIGFMGSDHSLDILPGYNKVTIKDSNYPIGDIFQEEDFKSLSRLGDNIVYAREYVVDNRVSRKMYFLPNIYRMYHYEPGTDQNPVSESDIKSMSLDDVEKLYGALPIKRCNYELKQIDGKWEPDITNYNYEDLIQIRTILYPSGATIGDSRYLLKSSNPILTFAKHLPTALYKDGAFAIQGSVQLVMAAENNLPNLIPIDEMYSFGDALPDFAVPPYFVCELSIGNKYWNGEKFVNEYSTFNVYIDDGKDGKFKNPVSGGFLSIKSTKTLSMPYDGLDGYIIPLAFPIMGELSFVIKGFIGRLFTGYVNCFLKDLKCVYQVIDGYSGDDDTDRIYENVLNEEYINEMDEIEFKISSYNNDGSCYSKVLLGGDYLTDNLYNVILGKNKRPEDLLINRIINHYDKPKTKLTQVLTYNENLFPYTVLTDIFMKDETFINTGGTIDFSNEKFTCIMTQK